MPDVGDCEPGDSCKLEDGSTVELDGIGEHVKAGGDSETVVVGHDPDDGNIVSLDMDASVDKVEDGGE